MLTLLLQSMQIETRIKYHINRILAASGRVYSKMRNTQEELWKEEMIDRVVLKTADEEETKLLERTTKAAFKLKKSWKKISMRPWQSFLTRELSTFDNNNKVLYLSTQYGSSTI